MDWRTNSLLAILVLIPTQGWTAEPVRIGVLLSMDGPAGCLGRDAWKGICAAQRSQSTVLGRPVQLVPANTHSQPSRAACAFLRLLEKERVCAVIGDVTASCTLAAAPLAEKHRIPLVSLSGPVPLSRTSLRYTIWTGISAEHLGEWCAFACRKLLGAKTVAIMQDNSQEFSIGVATCFAQKFRSLGGVVVHRSGLHAGQPIMGSVLERVRRARPDVLFAPLFATQCAFLAIQARGMGLEAQMLATREPDLHGVGHVDGRAVEGVYVPVFRHGCIAVLREMKALVSEEQLKCSWENRPMEGAGKDAYLETLDAIRQAQSTSGDTVWKHMVELHSSAGASRIGRFGGALLSR